MCAINLWSSSLRFDEIARRVASWSPPINRRVWLDRADAEREIDARLAAGSVTADEASKLQKFSRDGYFTIPLDLSAADAAEFERDVQRLWNERPRNVSFAYDSPPQRFTDAVEAQHRRPRYRIHDVHSASAVAQNLYLHPTLHRYASLILGEPAVATQSLYFEFGSQQALHRDSIVVPTNEFGRLVAAWIALEDISDDSGPLMYVPGSQRFPFSEFEPGRCVYDPTRDSGDDVTKAMAFYNRELEASGLPVRRFLARRGEVLVWHAALMHGGAEPRDESRTRKSFVVHYSSKRTQSTRDCAVVEAAADGLRESVFVTREFIERDGATGFRNPLDGTLAYRR